MKKKNLLKCLALTSMLALTVGAVTSCGTQGAKGDTGATGAQGPKGDKGATGATGAAGADGKTYLPVIVLADPANVTISQDQYFVEVGESFTLTFTANKGATVEMVTKLVINGVDIDVPAGQMSYTYTAVAGDKGFQIQSATFGTVEDYGKELIASYYADTYSSVDTQLALLDDTYAIVKPGYTSTDPYKKVAESSLYTDTVAKAASDSIKKVTSELAKTENKSKTASEKVAVVETVLAEAKTNMATAYSKVVTAAHTSAKALADTLYAAKPATGTDPLVADRRGLMTNADRTSTKTALVAAIDAATTLQGVANLVDQISGGSLTGSYATLEANRKSAFVSILGSYNTTVGTDTGFEYDSSKTSTNGYSVEINTMLNTYGITTEELPYTIYQSYVSKVSSELAFDTVGGTGAEASKFKLVKEAETAISGSIAAIRTKIGAAILEGYKTEINASAKLSAGQKTNAIVTIEGVISDWKDITENKTSAMTSYANYDKNGTVSLKTQGLLGAIETRLSKADDTAGITDSFIAERKANALSVEAKKISDTVAAALAADTDYAAAVASDSTGSAAKNANLGSTGATIANDIYASATLNINTVAATYVTYDSTGAVNGGSLMTTLGSGVGALKSAAATAVTNVSAVYGLALADYNTKQKAAQLADNTITVTEITQAALQGVWDDTVSKEGTLLKTVNFATVSALALKASKWQGLLKDLVTKVNTWVEGKKDDSFKTDFDKSTNEIHKSVYSLTDGYAATIIDGSVVAESANTTFVTTLDGVYNTAVSSYGDTQKGFLLLVYQGKVAKDPTKANELKAAYDSYISGYGTKVGSTEYKCNTYTSIDAWYSAATAALTAIVA